MKIADVVAGRLYLAETQSAGSPKLLDIEMALGWTTLETLRAEDRRIARILAGTQDPWSGPAEGDYRARLEARAAELADEIGYWERHLADLAAAGEYELPPAAEFTVGQRVLSRGLPATVVRVNRKSLTLRFDIMPQVTRPVSLDKIDSPAPELEPTT